MAATGAPSSVNRSSMLTLLEIGDKVTAPCRLTGDESHVDQQRFQFTADFIVGRSQTPCDTVWPDPLHCRLPKDASQKGNAAAVLFQQSKIDVQRQILLHGKAANIDDIGQLVPLRDLKRQFGPFFAPSGIRSNASPEGFVKQQGAGLQKPGFL